MSTLNQIKVEDTLYDIEDKEARNGLTNKVDKAEGKELSTNDFTNEDKTKLDGLSNYDDTELKEALNNKADKTEIPNVPTKTSELENDSGFLTEHQDLSEYAKKDEIPSIDGLATEEYVDNAIANIDIPNGGETVGGGIETIFDFTTTEGTTVIQLPVDTDELVEKLHNAEELHIQISVPRDNEDTETSTRGRVDAGAYMGWYASFTGEAQIIPEPTTEWIRYGTAYFVCFCNPTKANEIYSPVLVATMIANQGAGMSYQAIPIIPDIYRVKKGDYLYVRGTQNMAAGTRVIWGVRI